MFTEPKEDRRRVERRYRDRRLQRCEREIQAATRITSALFEHLALDELVVRALQIAIEVVNAECGSILLADPPSERLIFHNSIGACSVPSGTAISWNEGLAGTVFQSGEPIVIADAQKDPRHLESIDQLTDRKSTRLNSSH